MGAPTHDARESKLMSDDIANRFYRFCRCRIVAVVWRRVEGVVVVAWYWATLRRWSLPINWASYND
jgi:hypothetical protein